MAHEEALVLTKEWEWDPRTFPIFFLLSCRALSGYREIQRNNRFTDSADL